MFKYFWGIQNLISKRANFHCWHPLKIFHRALSMHSRPQGDYADPMSGTVGLTSSPSLGGSRPMKGMYFCGYLRWHGSKLPSKYLSLYLRQEPESGKSAFAMNSVNVETGDCKMQKTSHRFCPTLNKSLHHPSKTWSSVQGKWKKALENRMKGYEHERTEGLLTQGAIAL